MDLSPYPPAVVAWLSELEISTGVVAEVLAYLCGEEVGLTKLSEMAELEDDMLQHVEEKLPRLKRKNFRPAIEKLKGAAAAAAAKEEEEQQQKRREAEAAAAAAKAKVEAEAEAEAAAAKAKAEAKAKAKAKVEAEAEAAAAKAKAEAEAAAAAARAKAEAEAAAAAAKAKAEAAAVAAKAKAAAAAAAKPKLSAAEQKKQNQALFDAAYNNDVGKLEAAIAAGAEVDWHHTDPDYVSELSELE